MSIGLVMFGKALALVLWIAFAESWIAFRKRRKTEGLPLRFSRRANAYVVSDWTAWVDAAARLTRNAAYILLAVWLTILAGSWFFGGKEATTLIVYGFLDMVN